MEQEEFLEREKFVELEYQTLREEIAQDKDRRFKIAGLGFIGLPSAYYLYHVGSELQKFHLWVISLPLLVLVIACMYISKSRAIMRCGTYIKTKIETHIKENSKIKIGWENWLSENDQQNGYDKRDVDKILAKAFYILIVIYYLAATSLAAENAQTIKCCIQECGIKLSYGVWIVYLAIGVYASWFFLNHFKGISETEAIKAAKDKSKSE
ncbi:MAG: hypothetical protein ACRESZ_17915 [Methylococcales bacterium]